MGRDCMHLMFITTYRTLYYVNSVNCTCKHDSSNLEEDITNDHE